MDKTLNPVRDASFTAAAVTMLPPLLTREGILERRNGCGFLLVRFLRNQESADRTAGSGIPLLFKFRNMSYIPRIWLSESPVIF